MTITVSPIAGALGAEIGGVDLASDLSDDTVAEIRQAWLEQGVSARADFPSISTMRSPEAMPASSAGVP